jgi:hypothetical protein
MQLHGLKSCRFVCHVFYSSGRIFVGKSQVSCLSKKKIKLHGLSPRANYTDRATAACWRSDCQLVRIEGATWSA